MPRNTTHQAFVTGSSATLGWAVGTGMYGLVARTGFVPGDLAILGATVGAGVVLRTAIPARSGEANWRPTVRTVAGIAAAGATSASAVAAVRDSRGRSIAGVVTGVAAAVGAARAIQSNLEAQQAQRDELDRPAPQPTRAIVEGVGVLGILGALITGYRASGNAIARNLTKRTGLAETPARLVGRGLGTAAWGFGAYSTYRALTRGLALYDRVMDPGYDRPPESSARTGGPGSTLPFARLGRQGRRFITNVPTAEEIEAVMGRKAIAEPVRVFVGYDSARNAESRVEMAMDELRRTGAYERALLIVSCPAGTGFVDTLPMEVADFVLRGDVATVAVQYARLPSLLALHQTRSGALHHRLLLRAIQEDLDLIPEGKRPRVVVYGESLGAWAGQDAFIDVGTRGLDDLGVDLALWVGTPWYSKWRQQFLAEHESFSSGDAAEVDSAEQLARESDGDRRVVMLTHYNDPVAHLSHEILYKQPDWLGNHRPPNISPHQRWMPGITGMQSIIDAINATNPTPGVFRATGHDYRLDLPAVTVAAYRLPEPTPEQWERLMEKLQADEAAREARFHLEAHLAEMQSSQSGPAEVAHRPSSDRGHRSSEIEVPTADS